MAVESYSVFSATMFVTLCYNKKLMYVPSKITDLSVDKSFWEPLIYKISRISVICESVKIKDPRCLLFTSEFPKGISLMTL